MKIIIEIAEGVLGDKPGVAVQYRDVDQRYIKVDPTRLAVQSDLSFVVHHEVEHALHMGGFFKAPDSNRSHDWMSDDNIAKIKWRTIK